MERALRFQTCTEHRSCVTETSESGVRHKYAPKARQREKSLPAPREAPISQDESEAMEQWMVDVYEDVERRMREREAMSNLSIEGLVALVESLVTRVAELEARPVDVPPSLGNELEAIQATLKAHADDISELKNG